MALERNRLRVMDERKQSEQSRLLSSTLQKISSEHEENLNTLKSRLVDTENSSRQMADKLRLASEEVEASQSGYQMLQTKLLEERTRRERYYCEIDAINNFSHEQLWSSLEERLREMEETLLRERKEHTGRCQTLLNELMTERALQPQREESHRMAINELTTRCLDAESRLKDAEFKLERSNRDKNTAELELERVRSQLHQVQRASEGTITFISPFYSRKKFF